MADNIEGGDRPDLSPDRIVEAVLGRGGPKDLITLIGFLGHSDVHGHHRLFLDPALTCWLDIPDADIVHRHHIPEEHETYGGRSVLYVKREAVLLKGEVTTAEAEAEYLRSGDARALCWERDESLFICRPAKETGTSYAATKPGACCA